MDYKAIRTDDVVRGMNLIKEAKQLMKQRRNMEASHRLNDINDIFLNVKDVSK